MWTDFNSSFTVAFIDEYEEDGLKLRPIGLPPRLKYVSAVHFLASLKVQLYS